MGMSVYSAAKAALRSLAKAAGFLASTDCSFIIGEEISVDGGVVNL